MTILHEFAESPIIWTIAEIDSNEQKCLDLLPKQQNISELARFTHPKRRLEWLNVRLLAFELFKKLNLPLSEILKNDLGKPFCADSKMGLSFSHTLDYVAVAINLKGGIGIDIEISHERIDRIAGRVFDETERQIFTKKEEKTALWCAKEAIYKLDSEKGLDFQKNILVRKNEKQEWQGFLKKGNSIQKIKLGKQIWNGINVVWAIFE